MNTENELKRASESLARMIFQKIDALSRDSSFQTKEIKELTAIVKDLSAIDRSLSDDDEAAEIRVVFEGGDEGWAR